MLLTFSALSPVVSFYIAGNVVLHLAGTGAALAFAGGGVVSAILSWLYAEIAAAYPGAGGVYPSLAAILGPIVCFPYVVLLVPLAFAQGGLQALGLADYVHEFLPHLPLLPVATLALVFAGLIAALNVRFGALVTGIFLAIECLALAILSLVAALHPVRGLGEVFFHPVMLTNGALVPTPPAALALALVSGIWSTAGGNWALYFSEEMRGTRREMGLVVARTGALAALVIALPMVLLAISADDLKAVLGAEAPIATFLRRTGGGVISNIVSVGAVAAIFNALIASTMAYGRFLYSTGRDGLWLKPFNRFLGVLSVRTNAPVAATIILVLLSIASMAFGEKFLLVLLSGNVSDYLLMAIAILVARKSGLTGADFKAPLHPFTPLFGLAITAVSMAADWFDPDAGRPSVIMLTGLFLTALVYFHFRLRETSLAWTIVADTRPS